NTEGNAYISENVSIGTTSTTNRLHVHNDQFGTDSVVVITDAGNIGIGTTNPENELHILGNGSQLIKIESQFSNQAGIEFKGISTTVNPVIRANSDDIDFFTNGNQRMTIDDIGNIGINQGSPTATLHIVKGSANDPVTIEGLQSDASIDTVVTVDPNGVLHKTAVSALIANDLDWTLDGNDLYSAPDSTVVIKNGNVGIGSTNPGGLLTLRGSNNQTQLQVFSHTTQGPHVAEFYDPTGAMALGITASGGLNRPIAGDLNIQNSGGGSILFRTGAGLERMRIQDDGNVGINTTSPNYEFEVLGRIVSTDTVGAVLGRGLYSRSKNPAIGIMDTNAPNGWVFRSGTAGRLDINFGPELSPGTNAMSLTNTGLVGINTLNPTNQLHIAASTDPIRAEGLENDNTIDTLVSVGTDGVFHKTSAAQINAMPLNITTQTNNYSATTSDHVIIANTNSNNVTITLPDAAGNIGKQYMIKKADCSTFSLIVNTLGGTIDGASSKSYTEPYGSYMFISDGTNWHIFY
ncbi:MAG: hypothetical protein MRY83_05745, partial [Flavobacteriales bacterium]|nr:hypothetical protein [Flavobacteriales bacterium]